MFKPANLDNRQRVPKTAPDDHPGVPWAILAKMASDRPIHGWLRTRYYMG